MDYWAVRASQDSDWQLLFDDDRQVSAMEEVYWATNELHSTNVAHGIAPDATKGHQYKDVEELWRDIGVPEDMIS